MTDSGGREHECPYCRDVDAGVPVSGCPWCHGARRIDGATLAAFQAHYYHHVTEVERGDGDGAEPDSRAARERMIRRLTAAERVDPDSPGGQKDDEADSASGAPEGTADAARERMVREMQHGWQRKPERAET